MHIWLYVSISDPLSRFAGWPVFPMTNAKKIKKARELSDAQINDELAKLREEHFMRRFTDDPKNVKNPGYFREVKRTIARYLTVLNERAAKVKDEKAKAKAAAKAAAPVAAAKPAAPKAAKPGPQPAPTPTPVAPSIVAPKKK